MSESHEPQSFSVRTALMADQAALQTTRRAVPIDEPALALSRDIDSRTLGRDAGLLRVDSTGLAAHAIGVMAAQARRELSILTPDLEPALYDQQPFLQAVRRLAVERAGHLPVRVLLIDAESAIRRGLRLVELARRLSSSVQIAVAPEELAEQCDAFLVADDAGYCLRRPADSGSALIDFANPSKVRLLRRDFKAVWDQAGAAMELRRLHL